MSADEIRTVASLPHDSLPARPNAGLLPSRFRGAGCVRACPSGHFTSLTSGECKPCAPGTWGDGRDVGQCDPVRCRSGYTTAGGDSATCFPRPRGHLSFESETIEGNKAFAPLKNGLTGLITSGSIENDFLPRPGSVVVLDRSEQGKSCFDVLPQPGQSSIAVTFRAK